MQKGQLDPRQVPFAGYEARAEKIVKEISAFAMSKYIEADTFGTIPQYLERIPHPVCLADVKRKIVGDPIGKNSKKSTKYIYLNDFALDIRRIIGNFSRFNYYADQAKLRKDMSKILYKFETWWFNLHTEIEAVFPNMYFTQPLPELTACLAAMDDTIKTPSHTPNVFAVEAFINPVKQVFDPAGFKAYLKVNPYPISIGEIISKILEAEYDSLDRLKEDLDLMVDNCSNYWSIEGNNVDGLGDVYIKDAMALQKTFLASLVTHAGPLMPRVVSGQQLAQSAGSSSATAAPVPAAAASGSKKRKSMAPDTPAPSAPTAKATPQVPAVKESAAVTERKVQAFLKVAFKLALDNVKHHYIVGKANGVKVNTAFPFLKAVNPMHFPDYATIVSTPMDIARMEKKLDRYVTSHNVQGGNAVSMILMDMVLIRDNAHLYNTGINGLEVRIMADSLLNYFKYLLKLSLNLLLSPSCAEVPMRNSILTSELETMVREKDPLDVTTFLQVSGFDGEGLLSHYGVYKLVGLPAPATTSTNAAAMAILNSSSNSSSSSTLKITQPSTIAAAQPPAKKAKKASTPQSNRKGNYNFGSPAAAPLVVQEDIFEAENDEIENSYYGAAADEEEQEYVPTPTNNSKKSKNSKLTKRNSFETSQTSQYTSSDTYNETQNTQYTDNSGVYEGDDQYISPEMDENFLWEQEADGVLRTLFKHPYIDNTKPTVIADFITPIAIANITTETNVSPEDPLDLTTLKYMLDTHAVVDMHYFYKYVVNVFQYAYDYNKQALEYTQKQQAAQAAAGELTINSIVTSGNEYATMLIKRLAHLVSYTRWLCLETFVPLLTEEEISNNTNRANKNNSTGGVMNLNQLQLYELSQEQLDIERKNRETILSTYPIAQLLNVATGAANNNSNAITSLYAECKKMLKDLERCKSNAERLQLSFFLMPVNEGLLSDYNVYVRNPIDLSTIKYKLDGTLPSDVRTSDAINKVTSQRYMYYSEFVTDLKRVFTNALKYNKVHLATDTTGLSKSVYAAAEHLQARLLAMLPLLTAQLADKIERHKITFSESAQREHEKKVRREKEEAQMKIFEKQKLAELKASDKVFAADYDIEKKRQETEAHIKLQYLEQQKLNAQLLLNNTKSNSHDAALLDEMNAMSPSDPMYGAGGATPYTAVLAAANANLVHVPLLYGFGPAGRVPTRFAHLVAAKLKARERVWKVSPVVKIRTHLHKHGTSGGNTLSIKRSRASIEPNSGGTTEPVVAAEKTTTSTIVSSVEQNVNGSSASVTSCANSGSSSVAMDVADEHSVAVSQPPQNTATEVKIESEESCWVPVTADNIGSTGSILCRMVEVSGGPESSVDGVQIKQENISGSGGDIAGTGSIVSPMGAKLQHYSFNLHNKHNKLKAAKSKWICVDE